MFRKKNKEKSHKKRPYLERFLIRSMWSGGLWLSLHNGWYPVTIVTIVHILFHLYRRKQEQYRASGSFVKATYYALTSAMVTAIGIASYVYLEEATEQLSAAQFQRLASAVIGAGCLLILAYMIVVFRSLKSATKLFVQDTEDVMSATSTSSYLPLTLTTLMLIMISAPFIPSDIDNRLNLLTLLIPISLLYAMSVLYQNINWVRGMYMKHIGFSANLLSSAVEYETESQKENYVTGIFAVILLGISYSVIRLYQVLLEMGTTLSILSVFIVGLAAVVLNQIGYRRWVSNGNEYDTDWIKNEDRNGVTDNSPIVGKGIGEFVIQIDYQQPIPSSEFVVTYEVDMEGNGIPPGKPNELLRQFFTGALSTFPEIYEDYIIVVINEDGNRLNPAEVGIYLNQFQEGNHGT